MTNTLYLAKKVKRISPVIQYLTRNWRILLLAFLALTIGGTTQVYAYGLDLGRNITTFDGKASGTDPWYNSHNEDQEVEPGNQKAQKWDLEAFFLKGTKLSLVGGFDFKNGVEGWRSGDIFIDVDGKTSSSATHNGNTIYGNMGYEYVIDLNFRDMKYSVVELTASSLLKSIYYDTNVAANPWRYKSGGTPVAGWQNISIDYLYDLTDADIGNGLIGGLHNVVTVDLAFLNGKPFYAHNALECGNDFITAPIPGSLVLLGSGLVGLLMLGRRRSRQ